MLPMGPSRDISHFDSKFWIDKLRELGYALDVIELDLSALKEQKALPSDNTCAISVKSLDSISTIMSKSP